MGADRGRRPPEPGWAPPPGPPPEPPRKSSAVEGPGDVDPSEAPEYLEDLRPEAVSRSARVVIGTIEGPRFVPGDFADGQTVIDELERLLGRRRRR